MAVENFLVCGVVENMVFPPAKTFKCCDCGKGIGASKSSLNALTERDFKPICEQCFVVRPEADEVTFQRPTEEQLKEIRTRYPDFGEKEIRDMLEKVSKISGKKMKLK